MPIPFDRYVDLPVESNPSIDRAEFARRLRQASAAWFTCITAEAWPDSDYEIDEALGLPPG